MHATRGSNWKIWVLIAVLVIAVLVLAFLCARYYLPDLLGSTSSEPVTVLSTTVSAQDADGKTVTDSLSVTEGSLRPDIAEADADLILLDIGWAGKRDPSLPLIISVSNPAFTDNDGLAVYHYTDGAWELVGTYLIVNNTVSFRTQSLSPFAFEVISSTPAPTPTPEPTATPEPTETPEPTPTPYIIDYGSFSAVQAGTFEQADAIEAGGSYLIAIVNDPNVSESGDGVTFFGAGAAQEPITADVLLNYDGDTMRTIRVQLTKGSDGRYAVMDPVVAGMLWTAVDSDGYGGATRFALANGDYYLNLDEKDENVVMNDNATRTRWLYDTIGVKDADGRERNISTLTYRESYYDEYYISAMSYSEADDKFTFTSTKEGSDAVSIVLFRHLQLSEDEYFTGTVILTGTPSAIAGLDNTPEPTEPTPTPNSAVIPVTSAPTATPAATTPPSPTDPPEYTIAPPATDPPATDPPATDPPPVDPASGSNTGGETGNGSDSDT